MFTRRTILLTALTTLLYVPITVLAQQGGDGSVQLLADKIPGVSNQTTLSGYLNGLFQLGLGIAVVLAILQLVIGGFQYMTSDAISSKADARDRMTMALQGLILALATVLILQQINPDILKLNIGFGSGGGGSESSGGGPTGQLPGAEQAARNQLAAAGIDINNPCPPGRNIHCTNVAGLPSDVFSSLEALKRNCACSLTVTGGTEDGHQTHGVGEPFVDLWKNQTLDSYITQNAVCSDSTSIGTLYRVGNTNYVNEGTHWHSCVGVTCGITGHSGTC